MIECSVVIGLCYSHGKHGVHLVRQAGQKRAYRDNVFLIHGH